MNVWKSFMYRYEREEIKTWSSLRKTAYLLFPLLIYLLAHDVVEILLWALTEGIMRLGETVQTFFMQHSSTVQGIINGLAILMGIAAIGSGLKQEIMEKGASKAAEAEKSDKGKADRIDAFRVTNYFFLAGLAYLAAIGMNILFYQLGIVESSESFQEVRKAQFGVQFAVGLVLYGIISPFAEEAVFRGLIYSRMKRCFSYGVALVVSSLLFGCYHGNLVQAVYGFLLGLLIAYMYELFESFAAPVLFHSVANISVYVMAYHNGLNELSRMVAIIMAAIMLLAAVGILFYLKKQIKKSE